MGCLTTLAAQAALEQTGLAARLGCDCGIRGHFKQSGFRPVSRETRIQIMLDDAELSAIDDWRFKQRMPSRAAAIRQLLQVGLEEARGLPATAGRPSRDFGVFQRRDRDGEASE